MRRIRSYFGNLFSQRTDLEKGYNVMKRATVVLFAILSAAWAAPSIAVADFDSIGCDASVGPAVAEIIRTEIAAGEGLRVIERSRLEDVMAEPGLSPSGAA